MAELLGGLSQGNLGDAKLCLPNRTLQYKL